MVITTEGLNLAKTGTLNTLDNMTHIAVGSGTTAETVSQTALITEVERISISSTTKTSSQIEYFARIPLGGANTTLAEVGTFDASSSGNMGQRTLFDEAVTKTSDDELLIYYSDEVAAINN